MVRDKGSVEGLWDATPEMEAGARRILAPRLAQFESAVRECYELGVLVPTLSHHAHRKHLKCAALFLKRGLTDLRASWLMLSSGYTGPAATIVASLWEHALTVVALCEQPSRLAELEKTAEGDVPWPPMQLAKFAAASMERDALKAGVTDRFELAWRELYGPYKWLCKIKHPTFRSTKHEAFSASVKLDEFVVMAAPDIRPDDDGAKVTVLAIAVARMTQAVEAFAESAGIDSTTAQATQFRTRLSDVNAKARSFTGAIRQLPFDVATDKVSKEYVAMRRAQVTSQSNAHDA